MQKFFCIIGDLPEVFLDWLTYLYLRVAVITIPEKRRCNQQGCAISRGSFRGASNFQMDTGIQTIFNSPD